MESVPNNSIFGKVIENSTLNPNRARDEAIAAVREALARGGIGGPLQVTTVRMLDRAPSDQKESTLV